MPAARGRDIHPRAQEGAPIQRYDPLQAPDPGEWLALEEQQRMALADDYHRRARISLPNRKLHALTHVMVENQIALEDETPAQRTAARLVKQGLDRHEAIHAIGAALMAHISSVLKTSPADGDPNARYFRELERLTAKSWRREFG